MRRSLLLSINISLCLAMNLKEGLELILFIRTGFTQKRLAIVILNYNCCVLIWPILDLPLHFLCQVAQSSLLS